MDCQHWISFILEAEQAERRKLEYENRRLRSKLADIADMVKDVKRDFSTAEEWFNAQTRYMAMQRAESIRPIP